MPGTVYRIATGFAHSAPPRFTVSDFHFSGKLKRRLWKGKPATQSGHKVALIGCGAQGRPTASVKWRLFLLSADLGHDALRQAAIISARLAAPQTRSARIATNVERGSSALI